MTQDEKAQENVDAEEGKSRMAQMLAEQVDDTGAVKKVEPPVQEEIEEEVHEQIPEPKDEAAVEEPPVEPETEVDTEQPPPDAPPKEAPPAADDFENLVDKIRPTKGATVKTQKAIEALREYAKKEHKTVKEVRRELEAAMARKTLDETTEKELNELRTWRKQVAIERDPEFQQKYTADIAKNESSALNVMRSFNLPQETAEFIQKQGGLLRFRDSQLPMPQGTVGLDQKPFRGSQSDWWKDVIEPMINNLPAGAKTRINFHLDKATAKAIERDEAVFEAKGNPEKFFKQKEQEFEAQKKDFASRADAQLMKEADLYGEIAKPKELPANASAEQKAEITKHNATIEEAKGEIARWLQDRTPEGEISKATARAYRNIAQKIVAEKELQVKELQAKLEASEAKWNKAKSAAQTTRQQGVVSQPAVKATPGFNSDDASRIRGLLEQVPA